MERTHPQLYAKMLSRGRKTFA